MVGLSAQPEMNETDRVTAQRTAKSLAYDFINYPFVVLFGFNLTPRIVAGTFLRASRSLRGGL